MCGLHFIFKICCLKIVKKFLFDKEENMRFIILNGFKTIRKTRVKLLACTKRNGALLRSFFFKCFFVRLLAVGYKGRFTAHINHGKQNISSVM